MDEPQGFAKCLTSPIITLIVGDQQLAYHAHEEILCRLDFFKAALHGKFAESSRKTIFMPEDNPDSVAKLIEYLYTGDYSFQRNRADDSQGLNTPNLNLNSYWISSAEKAMHAEVYMVADKYNCVALCQLASDKRNRHFVKSGDTSQREALVFWSERVRDSSSAIRGIYTSAEAWLHCIWTLVKWVSK